MRLSSIVGAVAAAFTLASPATAADNAEVHTFHCLHGCPAGAPATNDLIVREIYTLSSRAVSLRCESGGIPKSLMG